MEQYELRPEDLEKNLRLALKFFRPDKVYARRVGAKGGGVILNHKLSRKKSFNIGYSDTGLEFKIGGKSVFFFAFEDCGDYVMGRKWSVAYERIWYIKEKGSKRGGKMNFAATGYPYPGSVYTGPDDPLLPEPNSTILRSANFNHYAEIVFKGKIPIRKTKYKLHEIWHYYEIDRKKILKKPLE